MKIKNFKSTKSLYGVEPEYFKEMKYFEAVEAKVELASQMIAEINEKIDYGLPQDEYRSLCSQLNECEKAKKFNEMLLSEYKRGI